MVWLRGRGRIEYGSAEKCGSEATHITPIPNSAPNGNMETITKRDLVVKISNKTGLTQQQVFDVIQNTLDTITATLANNDEVVLRNFGSFQVKQTKQKIGRNPNKPGTDVVIPPRAIVKFKPGKQMKERVATLLPELQQAPAAAGGGGE